MATRVTSRTTDSMPKSADGQTLSAWNTRTDFGNSNSESSSQPVSRVTTADNTWRGSTTGHQRFVLADPVAFRYLEDDRSVSVLERSRDLRGYQCYVVEQWACSRTHPTFIITAFTGNESHVIKVGVLSVPADEDVWSPRLKVYFKALTQSYARRKDTPLGSLMVTNLSGFPSALTIIHIPDGDAYRHREDFFVNEDLKRLGCSGRVGMTLTEPSSATQAKFYQLYRVSEKTPLYSSVIELVKLCQAALMLFGCLEPEYVDGLLCDPTEKAANDWWVQIGMDLYNVEPTDGILGPTTVSALLGTLIGARNRLSAYGAPIAKCVFELESTKRAIAYFQKAQRLPKTRRLDRRTLDRLHRATAKQAAGEGWNVPRAVKSTVAELSGKGGEMVMDIVGRGERTTIADVESTDIERLAANVKGERAKWLWHGKARKRTTRDLFSGLNADEDYLSKEEEDPNEYKGEAAGDNPKPRKQLTRMQTGEDPDFDPLAKKTMFKRAKGRLKGAVGKKPHNHTASKDSNALYEYDRNKSAETLGSASTDSPPSPGNYDERKDYFQSQSELALSRSNVPEPDHRMQANYARHLTETPVDSSGSFWNTPDDDFPIEKVKSQEPALDLDHSVSASRDFVPKATVPIPPDDRPAQKICLLLQRTHSLSYVDALDQESPVLSRPNGWPRNLSFSTAENSVLTWSDISAPSPSDENPQNPKQNLVTERLRAIQARQLRESIAAIGRDTVSRMTMSVTAIEDLNTLAEQDAEQLSALFHPRREEYHALAEGSKEIVTAERNQLQEAVSELQTLGAKLEYEIESLRGKVEDVEGSVAEFEKQVLYTEARVKELTSDSRKQGWWEWLTTISKKPVELPGRKNK